MDFITIAERLGVPTACLAVVGFVLYRILAMLLDRHFKTVDGIVPELKAQTTILREIKEEGCGRAWQCHSTATGAILPLKRDETG